MATGSEHELLLISEACDILRCSRASMFRLLRKHPELRTQAGPARVRRSRLMYLLEHGTLDTRPEQPQPRSRPLATVGPGGVVDVPRLKSLSADRS